jgi:hypothetical protein
MPYVKNLGKIMKNFIYDLFAALLVGLALCVGLLAYFDVLVK